MSENGNGNSDAAVAKKPRLDNDVEEKDFDEETQKALEEIDATQNEIESLNERKLESLFSIVILFWGLHILY